MSDPSRRNVLLPVILIAGTLPLYFIWTCNALPLTDFPNHVARAAILKAYGTSPFYEKFFFVNYFNNHLPIPDIVFDLFTVKLLPFMKAEAAARLFLSLYVLLSILSVVLLAEETGADTEVALLGYLPAVYCLFFNMALLNFIFSIPFFVLSLVVFLRYEKTGRFFYIPVLAVFAVVVYVSHLFSFFVLALTLIAYVVLSRMKGKKILLGLAVVCVALILAYLSGNALSFRNYPLGMDYKLHLLPLYFFSYPANYFDYAAGMAILLLFVAALLWHAAVSPLVNRRLAVLGVLFFLLYLVLPFSGVSGTMIDARALPFVLLMLLVSFGRSRRPWRSAAIFLFALVLAVKAYGSFSYYSSFPSNYAKISECMDKVADRSVLLPVCSMDESNINPYTHIWGYEVLKKEIVTPYLFAAREQPLKFRHFLFAPSGLWGYAKTYDEPPLFWRKVRDTYDYILLIGDNEKLKRKIEGTGRQVCDSGVAVLYRVSEEGGEPADRTGNGQ